MYVSDDWMPSISHDDAKKTVDMSMTARITEKSQSRIMLRDRPSAKLSRLKHASDAKNNSRNLIDRKDIIRNAEGTIVRSI